MTRRPSRNVVDGGCTTVGLQTESYFISKEFIQSDTLHKQFILPHVQNKEYPRLIYFALLKKVQELASLA